MNDIKQNKKKLFKMTAIIKNISITQEQEDFLIKHSHFSLSKMAQSKINEVMENQMGFEQEIKRLKVANQVLNDKLRECGDQNAVLEAERN